MKKGIDISKHQGNINFGAVKNEVDFVILREGYGITVDPKFNEYVKGCLNNDIYMPAVDLCSYALTEEQAAKEAEICVNNLKTFGCPAKIIFYDFEYDTVKTAKREGVTLGPKQCQEFTKAFCEKVTELGYIPGIYCNKDYYKNWYTPEIISSYILWLADYSGEPDYPCAVQQTSSTGKVTGIASNVDLNTWYDMELFSAPIEDPTENKNSVVEEGRYESDEELADDVISGKYGNGEERKKLLGDRYEAVQKIVNERLKPKQTTDVAPAQSKDTKLAGKYKVNCHSLYVRKVPGVMEPTNVVEVIKNGTEVQNYGYYTKVGNVIWLYIKHGDKIGFINSTYVTKL